MLLSRNWWVRLGSIFHRGPRLLPTNANQTICGSSEGGNAATVVGHRSCHCCGRAGRCLFLVDKAWRSKHGTTASTAVISDKSIAVLPFTDMSEKKDQEYFADGMAEEIIDLLVKIPGLKVISRTSSFQFKGKTEDLRSIATQLGVAYVLQGSVRKSGDRLAGDGAAHQQPRWNASLVADLRPGFK